MNSPSTLPHNVSPWKKLAVLFFGAFAANFILWGAYPGVSLALFFILLLGVILFACGKRRGARSVIVVSGLLLGACAATCIDFCFSNGVLLFSLTVILFGTAFYPGLSAWQRPLQALWSLAKAPLRWFALGFELSASIVENLPSSGPLSRASKVLRYALAAIPALVLCAIFMLLLGSGNAILGNWFSGFANALNEWISSIDISFSRVVFWIFIATLMLVLCAPAKASQWLWQLRIPMLRLPATRDASIFVWSSRLILIVLNALFLLANSLDAVFLWLHAKMPDGVSFSEFVHSGTNSLISAALLSGVILTCIFLQADAATRRKDLKTLAVIWIAQNLLLVSSVLLRLKLYVAAYQLSLSRVNAALFLLLVTAGFVLLGIYILREKSLRWLLARNAVAVLALFYIAQFADTARWVADYNVSKATRDPQHKLDVSYLSTLGPAAYPALIRVAHWPANCDARKQSIEALKDLQEKERSKRESENWRSLQLRDRTNAQRLLSEKLPAEVR